MGESACEGKQRNLMAVQIMNRFKSPTVEKRKLGKYAKGFLEHLHNTDAALCGFGLSILCERLLSAEGISSPFIDALNCSFKSGSSLGLKHGHRQSFCSLRWQRMLFGRRRSRALLLWRRERWKRESRLKGEDERVKSPRQSNKKWSVGTNSEIVIPASSLHLKSDTEITFLWSAGEVTASMIAAS